MAAQVSVGIAAQHALRCLLDTNVVIGLLQGHSASMALVQSGDCQLAEMAVSQITRLELLGFPGISAQEVQAIEGFLRNIRVLPISATVEAQTIALCQSQKIKLPDAIVAGTAWAHGLALLTLDKNLAKRFAHLQNL